MKAILHAGPALVFDVVEDADVVFAAVDDDVAVGSAFGFADLFAAEGSVTPVISTRTAPRIPSCWLTTREAAAYLSMSRDAIGPDGRRLCLPRFTT